MRRIRPMWAVGAALVLLGAGLAHHPTKAEAFPATARTVVIDYLRSITGTSVVSGQHNKEPASSPAQYTQQARNVTGQFPGLWGGDMMFRAGDQADRQRVIDEAKAQWAAGSLVALTWHACSPTVGVTCEFDGGVKTQITNAQFQEIVTGGTALNTTWRNRMATVVPYLRQLRDAGVPVLWRPFHEMNETWNWWGGRPGANGGAKIFQQMRDYFDGQGLDNLIWVWNVQDNPAANWSQYYPGANYADVVSLDVWWKSHPSAADYQQIQTVAAGKPIAVAEIGKMPTAALLTAQPRWAYFMMWSEHLLGNNTTAEIQAAYNIPRVLSRGEISLSGGGKIRAVASGRCVDVAGAGTANGTRVQIYTCDSGGSAQQWTAGSDGTLRALGKCLDVAANGTADGTRIQIWTCDGGDAQRFTYNAAGRDIVHAGSGKCLDVRAEATADATPLQLWTCNGKTNQDFLLPS
ncbi:ricin-type beta-trefoil lectin domain protein [Actinoplanes hulinensis]|uniref:Ricin-type beta-trefoil lectin domain protein n=1 Tax=Actinoplanes hulinensis TaxID=1144547 RepID=A0ABS7B7R7_9ACTN|nr:glycosyl hydrolase [Actinoplanes hulinensis]MBW6437098.1 ricin-type beta-trefoil lectin domain protein [Actinoplanes hulinensis]